LNKPGMQAGGEHPLPICCKNEWLLARDAALRFAKNLHEIGLHKQIVNRIVEPWMWITVIASGVDHAWENFFKLRCHPDAEPHIQKIAYMARELFDGHIPEELKPDEWHLPLFGFSYDDALDTEHAVQASVARCARISYLTHEGKRDIEADIALYHNLYQKGHWSPFEHVARPAGREVSGISNFGPNWFQHRGDFDNEYCTKAPRE